MRNLFLTSRNRRRAARIRVSRCLGAEIRQAGRHVRAGGGERRGGLKLIPVSSHDTPYNPSRSNVRVSLNVEKKHSEKQGKKERDKRGRERKSFLRVIRSAKRFFPFVHTCTHVSGIHAYFRTMRYLYMCAVEVCVMIDERERKGSSTERERERKDRLAKVLKKKRKKKEKENVAARRRRDLSERYIYI